MEDNQNKSGRVVVKKARGKQNLNTFVKGLLRRGTFLWKARNEAMGNARVERGKYKCASCSELFGPKQIILDHIEPVVDPKVGFTTWDDYINRMYPPAEGFQVLCLACSDVKTRLENEMRKHYKDLKKVDTQNKKEK